MITLGTNINMMKSVAFSLLLVISLSSCVIKKNDLSNHEIFNLWNYKTLNSIKSQISSTDDETIKKRLKDDLNAAKIFLYDKTGGGDSKFGMPIRSKFLEKISSSRTGDSKFYVLEHIEKGEKIEIRNMLIVNFGNSAHVTLFQYFGEEWHKLKDTTVKKVDLHSEIVKDSYPTRIMGTSILHVIVSEFNDNKIYSRYYAGDMINDQQVFFDLLYL